MLSIVFAMGVCGTCAAIIFALLAVLAYPLYLVWMPPLVYELQGKCAVVTGTSQGLGVAIAHALAKEGVSKLILTARRVEKLTAVADEISKAYPSVQVLPVQSDVSSDEDNEKLVATALETFGEACPIILVNNAGVESMLHFAEAPVKKIDAMLDVNLKAPIHLTHAFLPSIIKASGHVVNVGSVISKLAGLGFTTYAASKFGLLGFSQGLRGEMRYKKHPVTVHTVMPGLVKEAGMSKDMGATTGANIQDCHDMYGESYPHHTGAAVVNSIKYDHPEWIVNSVPVRVLAIAKEAFPRTWDFMGGMSDQWTLKCMAAVETIMDHQTVN